MRLFSQSSEHNLNKVISVEYSPQDVSGHMSDVIYGKIAHLIAERFVDENYQEIIKHVDMQAVANMTVAAAGAKIHETLQKKLPDKIMEIHKTNTQVYQRGWLGGIKRIA